jgi:hypothetical protein
MYHQDSFSTSRSVYSLPEIISLSWSELGKKDDDVIGITVREAVKGGSAAGYFFISLAT